MGRVHLSGLFIYPIKACVGIALERADVVERGLAFDRRYMLVDRSGTFITQREVPQLCRVATALEDELLLVSAPSMTALALPIRPAEDLPLSGSRTVCGTASGARSRIRKAVVGSPSC